MTTPSMKNILSGSRKYKLHLFLCNQVLKDIPEEIRQSLFNASTLLFFVPTDGEEREAEKLLNGKFSAEDVSQLQKGEVYAKVSGHVFNLKTPLPPEPKPGLEKPIIQSVRKSYCRKIASEAPKENAVSESKSGSRRPKGERPSSEGEEKRVLGFICQHPFLSIRKLYERLGINPRQGTKIKQGLLEQGLVLEVDTFGKKGRRSKVLTPTGEGLGQSGITLTQGDGSKVHQYLQSVIAEQAKKKGLKATIEGKIRGNESVDVVIEDRSEKPVAVEISVTTSSDDELRNIEKCLAAGFEKIVVGFLSQKTMEKTKKLVNERIPAKQIGNTCLCMMDQISDYF